MLRAGTTIRSASKRVLLTDALFLSVRGDGANLASGPTIFCATPGTSCSQSWKRKRPTDSPAMVYSKPRTTRPLSALNSHIRRTVTGLSNSTLRLAKSANSIHFRTPPSSGSDFAPARKSQMSKPQTGFWLRPTRRSARASATTRKSPSTASFRRCCRAKKESCLRWPLVQANCGGFPDLLEALEHALEPHRRASAAENSLSGGPEYFNRRSQRQDVHDFRRRALED